MDRLDLNHALMTKVIGDRLYLAPLVGNDLHRVLDIGTGTGICTLTLAQGPLFLADAPLQGLLRWATPTQTLE